MQLPAGISKVALGFVLGALLATGIMYSPFRSKVGDGAGHANEEGLTRGALQQKQAALLLSIPDCHNSAKSPDFYRLFSPLVFKTAAARICSGLHQHPMDRYEDRDVIYDPERVKGLTIVRGISKQRIILFYFFWGRNKQRNGWVIYDVIARPAGVAIPGA